MKRLSAYQTSEKTGRRGSAEGLATPVMDSAMMDDVTVDGVYGVALVSRID